MEIITREEVKKLGVTYTGFFLNTEIYDNLLKLEVGEGLVISHIEWPLKNTPCSSYINEMMKKLGRDERFSFRSMQSGKQYVFVRVEPKIRKSRIK